MTQIPPAKGAPAHSVLRRGNRLYLAIWCLLGFGAAGYLVVIATGKQFSLDGFEIWTMAGQESGAEPDTVTTVTLRQSAGTAAAADERWVRISRDISDLKSNVATISSNVTQIRSIQQQDGQRVARLEALQGILVRSEDGKREAGAGANGGTAPQTSLTPSSPEPAIVQASQTPAAASRSEAAIEGTTLDGVTRTSDAAPVTAAEPALSDDEALLAALLGNQSRGTIDDQTATTPAPVNIGLTPQITAPEPVAAAPTKPVAAFIPIPGQRTFGVELASGDSVDSLRLSWALLNERHRDLLGRLAPRFVQSGTGTSEIYRLIAGPFTSSTGARQLCTQLQAYYVPCQTSAFTGSVL